MNIDLGPNLYLFDGNGNLQQSGVSMSWTFLETGSTTIANGSTFTKDYTATLGADERIRIVVFPTLDYSTSLIDGYTDTNAPILHITNNGYWSSTVSYAVYRLGRTLPEPTEGILLQSLAGNRIIDPDHDNYYLDGPYAATACNLPGTFVANNTNNLLKPCATHYFDIPADALHIPLIDLPFGVAGQFKGGAIIGTETVGSVLRCYVLAVGYTPNFYLVRPFRGSTPPTEGMAVYDAAGDLIWHSGSPTYSAAVARSASVTRAATFNPSTYQYTKHSNSILCADPLMNVTVGQNTACAVKKASGAVGSWFGGADLGFWCFTCNPGTLSFAFPIWMNTLGDYVVSNTAFVNMTGSGTTYNQVSVTSNFTGNENAYYQPASSGFTKDYAFVTDGMDYSYQALFVYLESYSFPSFWDDVSTGSTLTVI